jgi:magnesium-transporting ATPase (P-type)
VTDTTNDKAAGRNTASRTEKIMTTLLNEQLETGDVIEMTRGDDVITALVLLAADEAVILDACDGSTPFVVKRDELIEYRKFIPSA